MAAFPPLASPEAFVVVFAFWVACASSLPRSTSGAPLPTDAVVVTFEIAIAATAANDTEPLPVEAPPSAVVVIESVLVAVMVRLLTGWQFRSTDGLQVAPVFVL